MSPRGLLLTGGNGEEVRETDVEDEEKGDLARVRKDGRVIYAGL